MRQILAGHKILTLLLTELNLGKCKIQRANLREKVEGRVGNWWGSMRVAGVYGVTVMIDEVRFNGITDDSESDLVNCHTSNRCEDAQLEYLSLSGTVGCPLLCLLLSFRE